MQISGKKGTSLWDQMNADQKVTPKKTADFKKYTSRQSHGEVIEGEVEPSETPTGVPSKV